VFIPLSILSRWYYTNKSVVFSRVFDPCFWCVPCIWFLFWDFKIHTWYQNTNERKLKVVRTLFYQILSHFIFILFVKLKINCPRIIRWISTHTYELNKILFDMTKFVTRILIMLINRIFQFCYPTVFFYFFCLTPFLLVLI